MAETEWKQVGELVESALADRPRLLQSIESKHDLLLKTAVEIRPMVSRNVLLAHLLQKSIEQAELGTNRPQAAANLRDTLKNVAATASFRMVKEAELPAGFPEPTPVGEIQIKQYPAYRMALAPPGRNSGIAFWTLFNHIKSEKIEMTAPVQMNFDEEKSGQRRQQMGFLYGSTELGRTGKHGDVEVRDIPASLCLSMGIRGENETQTVVMARELLEEWLKTHSHQYEATGPARVMGYNSPSVPKAKSFLEVEIPVRSMRR